MIRFFNNITKYTDDKKSYGRKLLLKLICMLAAVLLFTGLPNNTAEASSEIKIYNYTSKKTSTYTGIQPKITLNGKEIGNSKTPGILMDGIALVSYYDVFYQSNIDADCVYNKAKGTVSISKYGTTITMTIGSKKATVNGKAVTLPVAPMRLKYAASGLQKILVPSRFVSETLGFGYTWDSATSTISIQKHTIQLSYNNAEKFEYNGIQGKVTIDGMNIELGSMPGIITNNTAMLRANKVFADSPIGASYSFIKSNQRITLKKGDKELVMTIGEKTAYLNNQEVTLDTAPMIITNCETGDSYVMVPGSFTASSLGYDYTWNKSTRTSMIATRKEQTTSEGTDQGNTDPELGDTGAYNDPGTILSEWKMLDSLYSSSSGIHELDSGISSSGITGNIYYAARDYSNIKNNAETFMVMSSVPFTRVKSGISGNLLSVYADSISCLDQTYQMYGLTSSMVNTLGIYNYTEGSGTVIELDMLSGDYEYDLSFSADKLILYITVYKNCLTSAVIGRNDSGDYLTLNGMKPLKAGITSQSNLIYIDLPSVGNGLGDVYSEITGSKYIRQFYAIGYADKTQIILAMNEGYEYYIIENGNQYTLSFRASKAPEEEQEPPEVIDKSKYEIVIPKPSDVTKSMISDEDFYFKNYFVVRLKGDYTGFYNNNNISYSSGVVDRISVSLGGNGETEIKIATTKLQGYEIASDSEAIYVHIGDPREIYKNIAVLDPGHGGTANGAHYFGSLEKNINLKVLYTLGNKYFNSDTSKLKVYYTRTSDVDMGLSERAAFVKKVGADIFISLHMNAADAPGVHGSEVFYSVKSNTANSAGLRSQDLAAMLNTNLYTALGTADRGVKTENYTVIYKNTVPAVLIELGFLSNKGDYALLTDEAFQDKAAKTIYETLLQIFEAYPTGR